MKILFISNSPINRQTSIGNTFLNLFEGYNAEFYSIYSRTGYPDKKIKGAFRISETQLVKNIFNSKKIGEKIENHTIKVLNPMLEISESSTYEELYLNFFSSIKKEELSLFSSDTLSDEATVNYFYNKLIGLAELDSLLPEQITHTFSNCTIH